ncbi:MAG: redox-regulated ATPase YchF [Synergistaceae bacterium]|nr:redox-regulated ATPase YchF [Synergistaceae bacterium]
MLKCGIVGLPLCGKSTVFNVITGAGAEVKPYASGKTEPNRALVNVPDGRFDRLVEVFEPKKATPAVVEFVDLAGVTRSSGGSSGNSFLSFAAEADALVHVVRGFENKNLPDPSVDPVRDWRLVETELVYRDLGVIENRLSRLAAKKKTTPEEADEAALLKELQEHLLTERPLRERAMTPAQMKSISGFSFLTLKPEIVVFNLGEGVKMPETPPAFGDCGAISMFGALEMDLAELAPEEREEFTRGVTGLERSGRDRLIGEAYRLLGLVSFFTTGKDEVKAWTLRDGSTAKDAAGTIHSDLARGFIRAQVVSYEDFIKCGASIPACRDKGVLRLEGKEYVVRDGDMIEIRFNV